MNTRHMTSLASCFMLMLGLLVGSTEQTTPSFPLAQETVDAQTSLLQKAFVIITEMTTALSSNTPHTLDFANIIATRRAIHTIRSTPAEQTGFPQQYWTNYQQNTVNALEQNITNALSEQPVDISSDLDYIF